MIHRIGLATFSGLAISVSASGQVFLLDDLPNTAEDPFGLLLPAAGAGFTAPSPSMGAFGYFPGLPLGPVIGPGVPPHLVPPNGTFINAISDDKERDIFPTIRLQFTVDRATSGLAGTPLAIESGFFQAPGDVYTSTAAFTHPIAFLGTLTPGIIGAVPTFGGVLPTAGGGGANVLSFDESVFGMTAIGAPGGLTPPGVPTPPTLPGVKDNMNAWNNRPIDITGDMINDMDYFFSVAPAEALVIGVSSADIFDVAAGAGGTVPTPYAPAFTAGLDFFGHTTDDIDALILFDAGLPLGPAWGGPGGEPAIDYALFSLGPGSATLSFLAAAGLPVDPATVFFTDFTGSFGIYAYGTDLGIDPAGMFPGFANIDGLDFVPAPGTLSLLALAGIAARRRRA
ncbi:MAG: hypothetical protein H6811_07820 [Phycisphaeraceae bacterium]|nr:hypothetical protein [Phycisphaeraceae bacterium]